MELICLDVGGLSSDRGELDAISLMRSLCTAFGDSVSALVIKSQGVRKESTFFSLSLNVAPALLPYVQH